MPPIRTFFNALPFWSDVEVIYNPPAASKEPKSDSETTGSSNHSEVFNRRFLSILNRVEFVKKVIYSTVIGDLLRLKNEKQTLIGFDIDGILVTVIPAVSYDIGDCKHLAYNIYTTYHVDGSGYVWHHATAENPINNSMPQYRDIYFLLWSGYQADDKTESCNDSWNLGYSIYVDLEGALIFTGRKKVE